MGAKKGRCAAVIAAVLLMASCIGQPACGRRVETMAGHYKIDSLRAMSGVLDTPIDVYRDQLPPDEVFFPGRASVDTSKAAINRHLKTGHFGHGG